MNDCFHFDYEYVYDFVFRFAELVQNPVDMPELAKAVARYDLFNAINILLCLILDREIG